MLSYTIVLDKRQIRQIIVDFGNYLLYMMKILLWDMSHTLHKSLTDNSK